MRFPDIKTILKYRVQIASGSLFLLLGLVLIIANSIAPSEFPRNLVVKIPAGTTINEAGKILKDNDIIRSIFLYRVYVTITNGEGGVKTGDYLFEKPESALSVAMRTVRGEQNIQKIKVTIPEGSSSKEIAKIMSRSIKGFDSETFLSEAKKYEGYLFPETYYFFQNVTPDEVIKEMRSEFENKIADIQDKIDVSSRSLEDIIKMASIIEEEASNDKDRKIISGILWKRIDTGMALQVDAPFYYTSNKTSNQISTADLRADSPYNTYTRKGLPPTAISNPGMNAIENALYPETSKYWFFLSGKDGTMHYATTHDGHIENKWKYLQ